MNFPAIEKLIYDTIHKHQQRNGGAWDDLLSEAFEHCVRAARSHNPDKSKLSTWIRNKVAYGLLDWRRKQAKRKPHGQLRDVPRVVSFDVQQFAAELSPDAQTVIGIVITGEVTKRKALVRYLLHETGWAARRVLDSFREIREALR